MRKLNGKRAFFYLQLKRIRLKEEQLFNELRLVEKRIERLKIFNGD